jgi:hypothetical protein
VSSSQSASATSEQGFGGFSSSSSFEGGFNVAGAGLQEASAEGGSFSSFESSSFSAGAASGAASGGFDLAASAFNSADTNQDGTLSRDEFAKFYQQGL